MTRTNPSQAIIIYVRGIPGSGKSYFAHQLAASLQGETIVELDPDAIDKDSAIYQQYVSKLTEQGVDPAIHAYRFLREQAYRAIENGSIAIWNQPFTNLEIFSTMVQRMHDHAAATGMQLEVLVVEVETAPALARERVMARKASGGHGPSDTTFERFVNSYTSFAPEGYKTITVKDGDDQAQSIATVQGAILALERA